MSDTYKSDNGNYQRTDNENRSTLSNESDANETFSSRSDAGRSFIREDLRISSAASNLAFNEKVKSLQAEGSPIIHFGFGQSPFPAPRCLEEALKQHAHRTEYVEVRGLSSLRHGIAAMHEKEDNLSLDPDNIIVGPGSKQLIYLTLAVCRAVVVVPAPAWTTYGPQVRLSGNRLVEAHTSPGLNGGYKINRQQLEDAIQPHLGENIFLILTTPGNPSGTVYTDSELRELSVVCRRYGIVVLSDEIYARLNFACRHASILKHYPEGSIILSGFSKSLSAGGWRLGYAHYPSQLSVLMEAVAAAASQTHSCAPAPMQHAVAQVLRENYEELRCYMSDCTAILQAVGDYCYRHLLEVGVAGTRSEAGFYLMPDLAPLRPKLQARGITTGPQLTQALLTEASVAVMPSCDFLMPLEDLSTRLCFICFDGSAALQALWNQRELHYSVADSEQNHQSLGASSDDGCSTDADDKNTRINTDVIKNDNTHVSSNAVINYSPATGATTGEPNTSDISSDTPVDDKSTAAHHTTSTNGNTDNSSNICIDKNPADNAKTGGPDTSVDSYGIIIDDNITVARSKAIRNKNSDARVKTVRNDIHGSGTNIKHNNRDNNLDINKLVLTEQFVEQYCGPVVTGINNLKNWILKVQNS